MSAEARWAAKAAAACWWDGGPAWDPVKTAMRTPRTVVECQRIVFRALALHSASRVGAGDPLGDADRLFSAPTLPPATARVLYPPRPLRPIHRGGDGVLQPAGDLLHVLEPHARPDLRADRHRRGEPHLVEAVVHA